MGNKTTLVVTAVPNPNEQESMQAYVNGVTPLLMEAGGQLVKRLKVQSAITGEPPYGVVLVMDFPDQEKLEAVFASEAYTAFLPDRAKAFTSVDICFASEM